MVAQPSLKRRHSTETDSESEQDDHCDASISSSLSNNSTGSRCFNMARKKRRGLIEKRRRDRINRSLNDLKNLIPTAHERQASAKLEKSEVLSLAVDHIKSLSAKLEHANPQTLAMDYRSIGYRECVGEVVNYLLHGEGLGPANQLHMRIASHLHHQLSVYDQRGPSPARYCGPPSTDPAYLYADTSPIVNYSGPVQVCKPEPTMSPSYCGSLPNAPVEYNNYQQYNADCVHNTGSPTTDTPNAWQTTPSSCQNDSSAQTFPFAPHSPWA